MKFSKKFKIQNYSIDASLDGTALSISSGARALTALKRSLINIIELIENIMRSAADRDMRLEVKFRVLKDAFGMYFSDTGIIKIDSALVGAPGEMEKIIFHEAVHYIFETYYKDSWFYELFQEAASVYFQNHYYSDDYIFHKLVADRFGPNQFAAAYYILNKLNETRDYALSLIFRDNPDAKTVRRQRKIVNALIDDEYSMTKALYDRLIKSIDIVLIDDRPRKGGGGYGVIYRKKQMYSPFIAYLPPRSLNNLDYKDIYVHVAKIPERFSNKFILREPDDDYLETLATIYAQASVSIPEIKEKVFNSSLLYS
ncbi:MAG TPA: hypothetical protein PK467_00945 [Candidatus Wallbacteria bacterium]|nr:hypothetical protein [Candidatus Wallbacteria bacterium]